MITKTVSSTGAAMMTADEVSDLTESQIFAALPNPIFVLDLKNKFISSEDIYITRQRHRINLEKCVEHLTSFENKNFDLGSRDLTIL